MWLTMPTLTPRPGPTCLDLSGLTFADGEGAALLCELIRSGAKVVGCSSFIAELLHFQQGVDESDETDSI